MRLTFCGAARTVTGSKHLVELDNGKRLLLDCGLFQGRRAEAEQRNREFPFDPRAIDAVLLSHAHIDHSGLLPKLWKEGFRGKVFCTHATYSLSSLMLLDSGHIQEKDARFVNKIRQRKHQPPVEPLYDQDDAREVLELFVGVPYRRPFEPLPGVSVRYFDAGHILGAASMVLEIGEGGSAPLRLGFTGDVGNADRPILRDPQPMPPCDYLISESTYGGKVHEPPQETLDRLEEVVRRTVSRGGKLIIPSFAVGRTQEIVYALDQLETQGRLPSIPVFVDSPLAVSATGVYMSHPECYDEQLLDYMRRDDDPFGFEDLTYVREASESKKLNTSRYPMVIISASGMCEAGRILHHLRHNIGDPRATIMIVGYCADHTLGKRLVDRERRVRIFGEDFQRRAEVVVMNRFSAHADEPGLRAFLAHQDKQRLQELYLVHGSYDRQQILRDGLLEDGFRSVRIPEPEHSEVLG